MEMEIDFGKVLKDLVDKHFIDWESVLRLSLLQGYQLVHSDFFDANIVESMGLSNAFVGKERCYAFYSMARDADYYFVKIEVVEEEEDPLNVEARYFASFGQ